MREAPIRLGIITLSPSVTNSCPDPILFICLHHCQQPLLEAAADHLQAACVIATMHALNV